MSWLTIVGSAIAGFFSALPKILDEFSKWRQSQETAHEEEVAKKIDETTKETKDAKTDEERRKVASKWTAIIKSFKR